MLKTRIITALILLVVLAILLFFSPRSYAVIAFGGVAVLGAWEWAGFLKAPALERILFGAAVGGGCGVLAQSPQLHPWVWAGCTLFWLLLAPLWLWRRWTATRFLTLSYLLGALLLLGTWSALCGLLNLGPRPLLMLLASVWVADIAAYFAGRRWGRHKLAPAISPGKTWEGAWGGVLAVVVYGCLVFPEAGMGSRASLLSLGGLALFLVGLTAVSILGDLMESLLKRQAGLKDSSQLLPGHGGILDRIDSLMSTVPMLALYIFLGTP